MANNTPQDPSQIQLSPETLARLSIPVTGQMPGVTQNPPMTFESMSRYLPQGQTEAPQGQTEAPQSGDRLTQIRASSNQPASIRSNNPGAMWPGPSSARFGATQYERLKDGNLIAHFDNPVNGAAAQFDLLGSGKYINRPIGDIIDEWSGHTGGKANVSAYASHVANSIGVSPYDRLTSGILQSPQGILFAKAMARMEAGQEYPLSDDDWRQAQNLAFPNLQQQQFVSR